MAKTLLLHMIAAPNLITLNDSTNWSKHGTCTCDKINEIYLHKLKMHHFVSSQLYGVGTILGTVARAV